MIQYKRVLKIYWFKWITTNSIYIMNKNLKSATHETYMHEEENWEFSRSYNFS